MSLEVFIQTLKDLTTTKIKTNIVSIGPKSCRGKWGVK